MTVSTKYNLLKGMKTMQVIIKSVIVQQRAILNTIGFPTGKKGMVHQVGDMLCTEDLKCKTLNRLNYILINYIFLKTYMQ